jgi:hypothetical protein
LSQSVSGHLPIPIAGPLAQAPTFFKTRFDPNFVFSPSRDKNDQHDPIRATKRESLVDEQTQQRLETPFAAGRGFGLSRLVAERFIKDAVPEQRGSKTTS